MDPIFKEAYVDPMQLVTAIFFGVTFVVYTFAVFTKGEIQDELMKFLLKIFLPVLSSMILVWIILGAIAYFKQP